MKEKFRQFLEQEAANGRTVMFKHLLKLIEAEEHGFLGKDLVELLISMGHECVNNGEPNLIYLVSRSGKTIHRKFFNTFELDKLLPEQARLPLQFRQDRFYEKVKSEIFDYWLPKTKVETIARIMI